MIKIITETAGSNKLTKIIIMFFHRADAKTSDQHPAVSLQSAYPALITDYCFPVKSP